MSTKAENKTRYLVFYFRPMDPHSWKVGPFYRRVAAEQAAIRLAGRSDVRSVLIASREPNEED